MSQRYDQLLRANAAFYEAFASGDLDALDGLWARHCDVAVLHPGWPAVFGRDAVMESWRGILEGPQPPEIACGDARAFLVGDSGFVICIEHLGGGMLLATNIFAQEDGDWRLAHHQAGPTTTVSLESERGSVH